MYSNCKPEVHKGKNYERHLRRIAMQQCRLGCGIPKTTDRHGSWMPKTTDRHGSGTPKTTDLSPVCCSEWRLVSRDQVLQGVEIYVVMHRFEQRT